MLMFFLLWFWKQAQKQFRKDVGRSVPDSSLKSLIAMPKIARIASVFPLNSGFLEMYVLYTPAQFSSQELWTAQNNVLSIIAVAQNYSSNSCNSWCFFGWRRGTESEMSMHFPLGGINLVRCLVNLQVYATIWKVFTLLHVDVMVLFGLYPVCFAACTLAEHVFLSHKPGCLRWLRNGILVSFFSPCSSVDHSL
jgi:hypothetical protein